jgi:hypothetical protein
MTTPDPHAHGALNPLAASDASRAWEFADQLWAWRLVDGDVVLQGPDGDVTIPARKLPLLARSLLAVHVQNGRPEFKASVR